MGTVRRQLGLRRVGHTGTLDPFATGLLIVVVNRATRLVGYLSALDKEYQGVIRLGQRTSTDDPTGEVLSDDASWNTLTDDAIHHAMQDFVGQQRQVPPVFSAKKTDGQRAYERARRGEVVTLAAKDVTISRCDLHERSGPNVTFMTTVSTGTYIRSLARDLGEQLGCGAHLAELRRVAIGRFPVDEATAPESVNWDMVQPAGGLVDHLHRISASEEDRRSLSQGRRIPCERDVSVDTAAVFADGRLVGIAEMRDDGYLYPRVVLD